MVEALTGYKSFTPLQPTRHEFPSLSSLTIWTICDYTLSAAKINKKHEASYSSPSHVKRGRWKAFHYGKVSCAPSTFILPCFLKIWIVDFRSILLSNPQDRSILHLTPPNTPPTSCAFLLFDLKLMVQILRKHESTDVLEEHDTFPFIIQLFLSTPSVPNKWCLDEVKVKHFNLRPSISLNLQYMNYIFIKTFLIMSLKI
jgi:hypothetical protein